MFSPKEKKKGKKFRTSLVVQWLRIQHSHCSFSGRCCGVDSVPRLRTSPCCRHGQKKRKKKKKTQNPLITVSTVITQKPIEPRVLLPGSEGCPDLLFMLLSRLPPSSSHSHLSAICAGVACSLGITAGLRGEAEWAQSQLWTDS